MTLPATLYATLTGSTGSCGCAPATITLTQNATDSWSGFAFGSCGIDLHIYCNAGGGGWFVSCETMGTSTRASATCDPFEATVTISVNPDQPNKPCDGSVTYHITA